VTCERCGGRGSIVVCIDDMCHGTDHCMHGDGNADCPDCADDSEFDWDSDVDAEDEGCCEFCGQPDCELDQCNDCRACMCCCCDCEVAP